MTIIQHNEALRDLLRSVDHIQLEQIGRVIQPHIPKITEQFYSVMLSDQASRPFLTHDKVETTLKSAMGIWLVSLYTPHSPEEIDAIIKRQEEIGDRHARIGIPFSILQKATTVLKRGIFREIVKATENSDDIADLIVLADEMVDTHMTAMNQSYVNDMINDARENQSLKLQSLGIELALQTEGLRASLYDWHRSLLRLLLQNNAPNDQIPKIEKTHFGLWVNHKGDLLFPETKELTLLQQSVSDISIAAQKAQELKKGEDSEGLYTQLNYIDEKVTCTTEILSSITERTIAMESGKDQLTQLFNRRYLRTVLQKEVRMSNNTGDKFAIFIVDIDFFKKINDSYGHDIGDVVIKSTAEVLLSSVRAGDFVFRYGGEEFLIVVTSVLKKDLYNIAQKILSAFRNLEIKINENESIRITASIGGAIHDGHPDYETTVKTADNALYEAKNSGRDRYVEA